LLSDLSDCHYNQSQRARRESPDRKVSSLFHGPRARLNKIIIPSTCHPPLLCRSRNEPTPPLRTSSPSQGGHISSDPILSSYSQHLRPRPRVVKMVPIKTIRLKYQRKARKTSSTPSQKSHLYKYKSKFAMRNILQRSRKGRLNIINANNSNI